MGNESDAIPWAARRDGVKDGRKMKPVGMQEETLERQKAVKKEVGNILGYDVLLTDFKEAAYLHGLENPLEIATQLDEWGCEYA